MSTEQLGRMSEFSLLTMQYQYVAVKMVCQTDHNLFTDDVCSLPEIQWHGTVFKRKLNMIFGPSKKYM